MSTLKLLLGFVLLLTGSQLYWFYVAMAGLIAGDYLTLQAPRFMTTFATLAESTKYGLLGVIFSLTAKPMAILVAGFILGGFLSYTFPEILQWNMDWYTWPVFVLGGSVAVVLLFAFYGFALIFLTSAAGSIIIVQAGSFGTLDPAALLFLFFILGIAFQLLLMNYLEPTID